MRTAQDRYIEKQKEALDSQKGLIPPLDRG
jgi:hypothetical protein